MMHGYLPFDKTAGSSRRFGRGGTDDGPGRRSERNCSFNIPQRWARFHLYQAVLDGKSTYRTWLITTLRATSTRC